MSAPLSPSVLLSCMLNVTTTQLSAEAHSKRCTETTKPGKRCTSLLHYEDLDYHTCHPFEKKLCGNPLHAELNCTTAYIATQSIQPSLYRAQDAVPVDNRTIRALRSNNYDTVCAGSETLFGPLPCWQTLEIISTFVSKLT